MNLSPTDRRALVLGGAGLLLILVTRLLVMPWIDSWAAARASTADADEQMAAMAARLRSALVQRKWLARTYGPGVAKELQDQDAAQMSLYEGAQEVLKAAGLKATVYHPQAPRPVRQLPGTSLVSLQVSSKCALGQLLKLLAGLREAEILILVDRLSVTNSEREPGTLEVTLVLAALAETQTTPAAGRTHGRGRMPL